MCGRQQRLAVAGHRPLPLVIALAWVMRWWNRMIPEVRAYSRTIGRYRTIGKIERTPVRAP
jgi:hypothetical protein